MKISRPKQFEETENELESTIERLIGHLDNRSNSEANAIKVGQFLVAGVINQGEKTK